MTAKDFMKKRVAELCEEAPEYDEAELMGALKTAYLEARMKISGIALGAMALADILEGAKFPGEIINKAVSDHIRAQLGA